MKEKGYAVTAILVVLAACLIITSVLPLIPVTKQVTIYDAEVLTTYKGLQVWPIPYWTVINTSEGSFAVTDDFIIKSFMGEGDDCHFRICFNAPNDYHITLHETLFGAYDTFSGMKRVTVGP